MRNVTLEKMLSTVVRHWNAGSTLTAAAAELGCSVPTLSGRLRRLHKLKVQGLPPWGGTRRRSRKSVAARARAVLARCPARGV